MSLLAAIIIVITLSGFDQSASAQGSDDGAASEKKSDTSSSKGTRSGRESQPEEESSGSAELHLEGSQESLTSQEDSEDDSLSAGAAKTSEAKDTLGGGDPDDAEASEVSSEADDDEGDPLDDARLDNQLTEQRESSARGVLSLTSFEKLSDYSLLGGGWLGEGRYNSWMGGFYSYRFRQDLWGEVSLGYGTDRVFLSQEASGLIPGSSVTPEYYYKSTARVISLGGRAQYYPSSELPLSLAGGGGINYMMVNLMEGEVFFDDLKVNDRDFSVITAHVYAAVGLFYVLKKKYFIATDIFTLAYQHPLHKVDSKSHEKINGHIYRSLRRFNFLPIQSISVGYLF